MLKLFSYIYFVAIFALSSCGKSHVDNVTESNGLTYINSNSSLYFKTTEKIVVEVFYEPGAEPFAGTTVTGMPYWKILEDNLKAIFQYRTKIPVIVVPKTIDDMQVIPAQNKTTWTPDDILALNVSYKKTTPTTSEAHFYIYFLKGSSSSSSKVIAESINGTPVIGVYKDVINANNGYVVQRYVEQSTIVHEMGHALGFVNHGVPMKTPHQDTAHGAHSTNPDCVMYWLNEGQADMVTFTEKFITSGNTVMWGPEVLEDAKAFSN